MSAYKNGSNYDIDRGIEPDYTINNIANYYDREALYKSADIIRSLGERTVYYGHGKPTMKGK